MWVPFRLVLQIYVGAMNLVSFLSFHLCIMICQLWRKCFAPKATKRSHSKIPFTKSMLWLSTFRCVFLCHFWIAKGWLFVDSSMDSGILKPLPECLAKTFCRRLQSVCLVGHTDSGGWILVNMASYYTWIRYFFIISAWSGTKIPIHLRKQQSPRPPLEKPCTLWESLYKSIHFLGDITHNLLEKSNFKNHHHSLPLGFPNWDSKYETWFSIQKLQVRLWHEGTYKIKQAFLHKFIQVLSASYMLQKIRVKLDQIGLYPYFSD